MPFYSIDYVDTEYSINIQFERTDYDDLNMGISIITFIRIIQACRSWLNRALFLLSRALLPPPVVPSDICPIVGALPRRPFPSNAELKKLGVGLLGRLSMLTTLGARDRLDEAAR